MKKIMLCAMCLIAVTANAQQSNSGSGYTNAVGIKFYPTGVTFKHFISDRNALEAIGYFFTSGARVTGLYEIHGNISNAGGLKWYLGPGAHIGFYNNKNGGGTALGIDGVLGLDYKVGSAPINLSIDWQPSIEFGNGFYNGFTGSWGGFAIRYTF